MIIVKTYSFLKKVLIISYFFPPCNLTAAQRILGWAKYLNKFGYYPTIVTRNWEHDISKPEDVLKNAGTDIILEEHENYEVYYLPYKASLRDRLFTKFSGSKLQALTKPLTVLNLIRENFRIQSIPHQNLYTFSEKWLSENPDVTKVVISGNPFNQFFFGYKLQKKIGVSWIADYRDDWNTTELTPRTSKGIAGYIQRLQEKSEKKWVGSAQLITSISPHYVQKISDFVDKPGAVVLNGYERNTSLPVKKEKNDTFTITYNGSLYDTQPIEAFISAVETLIIDKKHTIQLNFPGLAFDPKQAKRIERLAKNIQEYVHITNRIPRKEVLELQEKSDLLVMISHTNLKGIPSSKLYEYISLEKPVLQYPNDQDIVSETLADTGLGIICSSEEEIVNSIEQLILGEKSQLNPNKERIEFYSRERQTKVLAQLIDEL